MKDLPALRTDEEKRIRAVASSVFEQWQRDFGRWLVLVGRGNAPVPAQIDKLQELTGEKWTPARLKLLRDGQLFRDYVSLLRQGGARLARERIGEVAPMAVENLVWAMRRAKDEDNYESMPKFTNQILERALPRGDDDAAAKMIVNITLSPKQQTLLDSERPVIEAEVVKIEPAD